MEDDHQAQSQHDEASASSASTTGTSGPGALTVDLSANDVDLLIAGLHSSEYWDYATELDLPRRNGQVFLPEDDPDWWATTAVGGDEQNAIDQIRAMRTLARRLTSAAHHEGRPV